MNRNQTIAFWSMFAGFCVTATLFLHERGTISSIEASGGAAIIVASYLVVAYLIRIYVRKNPEEIDSWFR